MTGTAYKLTVVALLACAIAGTLALKLAGGGGDGGPGAGGATRPALPRLLDFGMGKCTQCRIMNGIMAELRAEYGRRLDVRSVDFEKDEALASKYKIRIIPAQVFLAPDGTELDRNEGLMSKAEILDRWRQLGYDLGGPRTQEAAP